MNRRNRGIPGGSLSRDISRLGDSGLEGIGLGDMILGGLDMITIMGFESISDILAISKMDQSTGEGAENDRLVRTVPIP